MTTITNLTEFLAAQGAETPHRAGRDLYKQTECGPWLSFILSDGSSIYYESAPAREAGAAWWAACTGVKIGSIVEGSDHEVTPVTLSWPFTQAQFEEAVGSINDEASAAWEEANED